MILGSFWSLLGELWGLTIVVDEWEQADGEAINILVNALEMRLGQ